MYSVTATDENGCLVSMEVEITQSEEMAISATWSDYTGYGVSCNGANDGSIDVTVTGGTGNYTYSWADGGVSTPISWPESMNPQDLNGGVMTETNATLMINIDANNIILGDSPIETGDLIGVFYEENGEYICAGFIVWDNSSMPPAALTLLGVGGNEYGLAEGAPLSMFILDSSTGMNYSVENTWNTATVPFSFNDGTDGYTANGLYQTLDMTMTQYGGDQGEVFASTEDVSDLVSGTYSVTATDENGCSVSMEVEITETEEMAISATWSDYTGYGVSA